MSGRQKDQVPDRDPPFVQQVEEKVARKLRVQRERKPGVWFGLGMSGLIGWSVAVPTVVGATLGLWLDRHHPSAHSWTLALLVAGLLIGCANAWYWMVQQDEAMTDKPEHTDE
jgi:ATP synthase protein I